jgi:hypothetical protein
MNAVNISLVLVGVCISNQNQKDKEPCKSKAFCIKCSHIFLYKLFEKKDFANMPELGIFACQ